jgi:aminopeptidase N
VSFLREFSAPVRVDYARADRDLELLAQHDQDGFVRWDALQTLWIKLFASPAVDTGAMLATIGRIAQQAMQLEKAEDKMLATTMLSMPEENYLFEQLSGFVVDDVLARHDALFEQLSVQHRDLWQALYARFRSADEYMPDAQGMADRGLANQAFTYLAWSITDQSEIAELIETHYAGANNLTDRRAAMAVASRHAGLDPAVRQRLFDDFYRRYEGEALVLDMWFSLQAASPLTDVDQLQKLEGHERFDLKTPNRIRSLFSSFANLNHLNFHRRDGSGYAYLADAIGRLDKSNPQLAARLATPLARWQRYDVDRQQIMKRSLQGLLDSGSLSKDLYEIVTKSLA